MDSNRNADLGGRYPGWSTISLAAQMRREGLDIPTSISPAVLVTFADAYYVEHTPPPPPSMARRMSSRSRASSNNNINRRISSRSLASNNNNSNNNNNNHNQRGRASSTTPPRSNRFSQRSTTSAAPSVATTNRTSNSLPRGFNNSTARRRPSIGETSDTSQTRVQFMENAPARPLSDPASVGGPVENSIPSQRLSATRRLSARSSRRGLLWERDSIRDLESQSDASAIGGTSNRRRTRAISQRRQATIEREYRDTSRGFVAGANAEDELLPDPEIEFKKPDYATARAYADEHQVRRPDGARFSTWGTRTGRFCFWDSNVCDVFDEQNVSEFASFGPGVSLHFKILKWFFWIFMLTTILTSPELLLNTLGRGSRGLIFSSTLGNLDQSVVSSDITLETALNSTALGNLTNTVTEDAAYLIVIPGISCGNSTLEQVDGCGLTRDQVAMLYSVIDMLVCSAVILSLVWLRYFLHYEERVVALAYTTASQFTLQIENVPDGSGEMAIARFFSGVIDEVADVAVAQDNGKLIHLYMKRGESLSELWKAAGYVRQLFEANRKILGSSKQTRRQQGVARKIREAVRFYDEEYARFVSINEQRRELKAGTKSITAFVTFKTRDAYEDCLEVYRKRTGLDRCRGQAKDLRLQGKSVRADPAPPPSTILWENLEYPLWSRMLRQCAGTLIVTLVVVLSVAATYGARAYRSELSQSVKATAEGALLCAQVAAEYNVTTSALNGDSSALLDTLNLVANTGSSEELACVCSFLTFRRAVQALFNTQHPCNAYFLDKAPLYTFTTLAAGVISVVNVICGAVIRALTRWEKHHSIVGRELSVGVRLFVVYLLNTGFVILVINANLPGVSDAQQVFGNGPYMDFTADWYADVGEQILIIMMINVVVPHFAPMLGIFVSWLTIKLSKPVVQKELNQLYVGPQFSLSLRSAQTLMTGTVALMYGGGMPILYPIASVSFLLFFWVDKFLIVRYYRHPPEYDARLSRWAVFVMSFAVVLHLGFTIWSYTTPGLLIGEAGPDPESINAIGEFAASLIPNSYISRSFWERVTSTHVMPLSILLCVAAFVGVASTFLSFFSFKSLWFGEVSLAGELPTFESAMDSGELRGLQTYNILHNPKYARAFGITIAFADAHKHVGDVRELPESQIPKIQEEVRQLGII